MEKIKCGILLAGGSGTRLRPATLTQNKHLLNILNEQMILFPLRTLKSMGIEDVLLVTGGNHVGGFTEFLGDGSYYGVNLTYRVQEKAGGIAQALSLAEGFVANRPMVVVLADNIFDNKGLPNSVSLSTDKATLFLKEVPDPQRFGVPVFSGVEPNERTILEIEEKPKNPKSSFAVTGLYSYPADVFKVIKDLKPSARGEYEITDVNNWYVKRGRCIGEILTHFWSDSGTRESLYTTTRWAFENNK